MIYGLPYRAPAISACDIASVEQIRAREGHESSGIHAAQRRCMTKKLTLNKETLRLLASTDSFDVIATDQTAEIQGGHVPKPGRSGWRGCKGPHHPKPGPNGMFGCSLVFSCPPGIKGVV